MARVSEVYEGAVFGRLTVVSTAYKVMSGRRRLWAVCQCSCGSAVKELVSDSLGVHAESCGCIKKEVTGALNYRHGMSKSATYKSWQDMWARCTCPNNEHYWLYKDRAPPEVWRDFSAFLKDMGECSEGLTLERVDNDKPYGPTNCSWVSRLQQAKNRSTSVWVSHPTKGAMIKAEALALEGLFRGGQMQSLLIRGWTVINTERE